MKKNKEGKVILDGKIPELTELDQKLMEMLKDVVNLYQRQIFKELEESYPDGFVGEMQFTHGRIVEILGEVKKNLVLEKIGQNRKILKLTIF